VKIIDRIQASSAREARKNVTTGIVKSIDFDRMNVVPTGSKGMLRSVKIMGDANAVAVGDQVTLMFTEKETLAMVSAVTTNPSLLVTTTKHADTHSVAGTDPLTPLMIGAAPLAHTHIASDISGIGNMRSEVYDADNDGVVDNARKMSTEVPGTIGSSLAEVSSNVAPGDTSLNITARASDVGGTAGIFLVADGTDGDVPTGNLELHRDHLSFYLDNSPEPGEMYIEDHKVWHEGNDGAGSGLDADTLDGLHGSQYLDKATYDTDGNGVVDFAGTANSLGYAPSDLGGDDGTINVVSETGNPVLNLMARTFNGAVAIVRLVSKATSGIIGTGTFEVKATNLSFSSTKPITDFLYGGNKVWHAGNDGAGSLLDADLLDGKQASEFEVPLTFSNGVTRTTNLVQLGGTLTKDTDIPLNSKNLTFSGTGKVGIGITAPAALLHVYQTDTTTPSMIIRGGLSLTPLGSDVLTNGAFTTDLSGWTVGAGWAWSAGADGQADHATGNVATLSQNVAVANGTIYVLDYTISNRTTGGIAFGLNGVSFFGGATFTSSNKKSLVAGTTGTVLFELIPSTDFDGSITNVTLKSLGSSTNAYIQFIDSGGAQTIDIRGNNSSTFFGLSAGRRNLGVENIGVGNQALYGLITGYDNVAIGYRALYNNSDGYINIGIGTSALRNLTIGTYNTAICYGSQYSNLTGNNNIAIGYNSLYANTASGYNLAIGDNSLYNNTANYNTAIGYNSLNVNTTGNSNTALGYYAARYLQTGSYNVALGHQSLYGNGSAYTASNYNVGIGYRAGYSLGSSSSSNVFVGSYAGYSAAGSASSNTLIGQNAGYLTTGSANVMLGSNAGYNETGSNKLYIANSNTATPMIYGLFAGTGAGVTINSQATDGTPLTIKGIASQANNLLEFRNSANALLAYVSKTGGASFVGLDTDTLDGLHGSQYLDKTTYDADANGIVDFATTANTLGYAIPTLGGDDGTINAVSDTGNPVLNVMARTFNGALPIVRLISKIVGVGAATGTFEVKAASLSFSSTLPVTDFLYGGNKIWHAGNDGASSTLDADLLDGVEGAGYALAAHTHNLTGNVTSVGLTTTIAAGVITDAMVAAANKDGAAGTASMRTLGTTSTKAAAGNHTHNLTGDVTSVGLAATIAANAVTNAKMATMAASTIKGAVGAGAPVDLTIAQVRTIIGAGSGNGLDADKIDGMESTAIFNSAVYWPTITDFNSATTAGFGYTGGSPTTNGPAGAAGYVYPQGTYFTVFNEVPAFANQRQEVSWLGDTWTRYFTGSVWTAWTKTWNDANVSGSINIGGAGIVGIANKSPQATLDVGGMIRSTTANAPVSDTGIELFYNTGNSTGYLMVLDRAAPYAGKALVIRGASVELQRYTADTGTTTVTPLKIEAAAAGAYITIGDGFNFSLNTNVGTSFGSTATQKLSFYGAAPIVQRAAAAQAAAPAGGTGTAAGAYDTAAHRDSMIALVNEMRTTLVNLGLMKGSA
jgi:hypothetical protein